MKSGIRSKSFRAAERKVVDWLELKKIIKEEQSKGKKVAFTNGCFDILHIGHVRYLQDARALADLLVVGVNSDESVRKLKGLGRPLIHDAERMEVLAGLECVDYVTLFSEDTPIKLIETIQPDIHIKGGDYKPEDLPEAEVMNKIGGRVEVIPLEKTNTAGCSTTNIVEKIKGIS